MLKVSGINKAQCFIGITALIKLIILHVRLFTMKKSSIISLWTFYTGRKDFSLHKKNKNTWVLITNTRFISRVEHDTSHSFASITRELAIIILSNR